MAGICHSKGLSALPNEVLCMIAKYLVEPRDARDELWSSAPRDREWGHSDLAALACASRHFSALFGPFLERYAVCQPQHGIVALHWSAAIGNVRLVRYLMKNGVNVTIFELDPVNGHQKLYGLPDKPYDPTTFSEITALGARIYVCEGSQELSYFDKSVKITIGSTFNGDSLCAYHQVISLPTYHRVEREEVLCSLRQMMVYGQDRMVEHLYECGARDSENGGAFRHAVEYGHERLVEIMLENGSDARGNCIWRFSPTYIAMVMGHEGILELLLDAGTDVAVSNGDDGLTALHVAAYLGYKDGLKMLIERFLEKGLSLDILDRRGSSAVNSAISQEWKGCARILKRAGARAIGEEDRCWRILDDVASSGFPQFR